MVFAEIREDEKEAFFSLLDQYFADRPHLLPSAQPDPSAAQQGQQTAGSAAAGFIGRQMAANPQATANLVSSALRANNNQHDSPAAQAASNPHISSQLGRAVASGMGTFSSLTKPPPPQPASKPPGVRGGTAPSGLVTRKAMGSYSTESKGAFFASGVQNALNYKKPQQQVVDAPLAPQGQHATGFAPPPRRPVAVVPEPEPEQEQEEQYEEAQEQQGEWVEALYDYQGDAATDISLSAGEQFVLVERTSADWWTGEHNGKRGLFPASYVKVL
ncbi:SH3-domain-containing protein [Calocera viscosa TUFC12733]|uniref:SH3-domain-containing protein n=1 Tax=Calocera viscosa (strain TUFC12733) TaxID=1330018 RepID=A0A167KMS6_CALVF|nr:SH3-domain-containing protein [Calocera viscosa TUFC12733]